MVAFARCLWTCAVRPGWRSRRPPQAGEEAAGGQILDFQAGAVQFGNSLHDGQPETAAFRADVAATIEAFSQPWQFVGRNARAAVGDAE